ncbi:unnamed protein product [Nesidiocoris tenuis]|uniref:Activin types I and II receptor domain-containing protein n=1 Tax=Nesidiocoris tenuis TaxID=355587 RepID=A0A6H5GES0_9HEMI|nr:unnamed protein product [Nesidiocoris tenuis]
MCHHNGKRNHSFVIACCKDVDHCNRHLYPTLERPKLPDWEMSKAPADGSLSTWELAGAIAIPIGMICMVIMVALTLWGQHKRSRSRYHCPESMDDPHQHILPNVSLRDMIDMTTSGSGSGPGRVHEHESFRFLQTSRRLRFRSDSLGDRKALQRRRHLRRVPTAVLRRRPQRSHDRRNATSRLHRQDDAQRSQQVAGLSGAAGHVESDEGMLVPQRSRTAHSAPHKENACEPQRVRSAQNPQCNSL